MVFLDCDIDISNITCFIFWQVGLLIFFFYIHIILGGQKCIVYLCHIHGRHLALIWHDCGLWLYNAENCVTCGLWSVDTSSLIWVWKYCGLFICKIGCFLHILLCKRLMMLLRHVQGLTFNLVKFQGLFCNFRNVRDFCNLWEELRFWKHRFGCLTLRLKSSNFSFSIIFFFLLPLPFFTFDTFQFSHTCTRIFHIWMTLTESKCLLHVRLQQWGWILENTWAKSLQSCNLNCFN